MQWWEVEQMRLSEKSADRRRKPWWASMVMAAATALLLVVSAVVVVSGADQPDHDDPLWEYEVQPACLSGSPDCDPACTVEGMPGYDVSVTRRQLGTDQEWVFWRRECLAW